ncbi:hypothetical protein lbkm_1342 [Lachnospiraceae bacterium KM106-2]|nr:hypothetical protein lbkm_1342 [Lachnospiraceae bacterium KM106-2]
MNFNNYMEQHESMKSELKMIKGLIATNEIDTQARELASAINTLAGRLNIHLLNEDKYLYPSLMKNEDTTIREMAKTYQNEMGDLSEVFVTFKNQYNTPTKILTNKESFLKEVIIIIETIEKRISKEEKGLYRLID